MLRSIGVTLAVLSVGAAAQADYVKFIYNPSLKKGTGPAAAAAASEEKNEARGGEEGGRGGRRTRPAGPSPATPVPATDELEFSTLRAEVPIEVLKLTRGSLGVSIRTKYNPPNKPIAVAESDDIKLARDANGNVDYVKMPTVAQRLEKEKQLLPPTTADACLQLADWALRHRLLTEFNTAMEQASRCGARGAEMDAWQKARADIVKTLPDNARASEWKEKLQFESAAETPHYTLLYRSTVPDKELADMRRLLEENYEAFFYWFAYHAKLAVRPPAHKLIVGIVNTREDFESLRQTFGSPPICYDGFYARADGLAILCTDRLDPAYEALSRTSVERWKQSGTSAADLLAMHLPRSVVAVMRPQDLVLDRIRALLLTAMKEQSQRATVTREGTRQLVSAVGYAPLGVWAPRWIQSGIASFFETPPTAYWPGTGEPNWIYLPRMQALKRRERLDKSEDALRKVITDGYFTSAHDEPEAILNARMMAWSLTYYLIHKDLQGLLRYYQELAKLPHDMAFDEPVALRCFARAFNLEMPDKPGEIDENRWRKLSQDWYRVILEDTALPVKQDEQIQQKDSRENKGK